MVVHFNILVKKIDSMVNEKVTIDKNVQVENIMNGLLLDFIVQNMVTIQDIFDIEKVTTINLNPNLYVFVVILASYFKGGENFVSENDDLKVVKNITIDKVLQGVGNNMEVVIQSFLNKVHENFFLEGEVVAVNIRVRIDILVLIDI